MFKHRFFVLLLVLPFFIFLDLWLGSIYIPLGDLYDVFFSSTYDEGYHQIVLNYRLPRMLTAMCAGLGLSISGLMMQTFFRNPLAGPFVLGISSGASLGVAIVILAFGSIILTSSPVAIITAAFLGSSAIFLLILLASFHVRQTTTLLIIGILIGSATSAVISILQYFSSAQQIEMFLLWTFGNLGNVDWQEMKWFLPIIVAGSLMTLFLMKPLNALLLGENYSRSLGIELKSSRVVILIITSILTGTITAYCGPIAFIGLAVPHIARWIFRTSDHKVLLAGSALCGMIIMVFSDLVSQWPGSGKMLPINAVTSLIGIPVVLILLLSKKTITTA